jgi:hypothetical protein
MTITTGSFPKELQGGCVKRKTKSKKAKTRRKPPKRGNK